MEAVVYQDTVAGVEPGQLAGFFVGWPNPPAVQERLEILESASEVVVATDPDGAVVGFATAITDGRFAAYLALVEVLPPLQGRGIGSVMVQRLLDRLQDCYMIDVVCDADVVSFYERLGCDAQRCCLAQPSECPSSNEGTSSDDQPADAAGQWSLTDTT
jgi:GNAT superfamily N-acetyltransferase